MTNKRVSLTYTVDLEDLEFEVGRLYARAFEDLRACVNDARRDTELSDRSMLSIECASEMDSLRKKLSKIDCMLADVGNIIGQFVSYQAGELAEKTPQPPSRTNAMMGELNDKLNTLQELMVNNALPTEEQNIPAQSDQ